MKEKIKEVLDQTNIKASTEIMILEYIDDLQNKIDKANIELEKLQKRLMEILKIGIPIKDITDIQDILRGENIK